MGLYTRNGRPLQVSGMTVYSRSGKVVGRIKNEKVYGTDGRYVGTIIGDRLVYRSTDSAGVSSPLRLQIVLEQLRLIMPDQLFGGKSQRFQIKGIVSSESPIPAPII